MENSLKKKSYGNYSFGFNNQRIYLIVEDLNMNNEIHSLINSCIENKGWFSQNKNKFISFPEFSYAGSYSYYSDSFQEHLQMLSQKYFFKNISFLNFILRIFSKMIYFKIPNLGIEEISSICNSYIDNVRNHLNII